MPDRDVPNPEPRTPGPGLPDRGPLTPAPVSSDELPPFGASWRTLYAAVAGTLAVLIVLFALFTRAFE